MEKILTYIIGVILGAVMMAMLIVTAPIYILEFTLNIISRIKKAIKA